MKRKNKVKIKRRILTPLCLVLVFLLSVGAFGAYWLQQQHIHKAVRHEIAEAQELFQSQIRKDAELLSSQIDFLEQSKTLRNAWLAKDRETLFDIAMPLFKHIRSKHRITHFYFVGLDRICFLRVHNPERYGDKINRFTMQQAEREGKEAYGIELGPFGTLTLRVVRPWKIDGKLAGYIELGEEITHITPELKAILGVELYFVINKSYLDRDKWEEGTRMVGQAGEWDQFANFVVIDHTSEDIPPQLFRYLSQLIACEDEEYLTSYIKVSIGQSYFRGGFFPLVDAGGHDVGNIIILGDITEGRALLRRLLIILITGGILVSTLLFVFLYFYVDRIENDITQVQDNLTSEIEKREKAEDELKHINQQLRANEQQLKASNQQLRANEQQLRAEITERKKTEEKLSQSLKEAIKSRKIMISMLDDNNQIREKLEKKLNELKQTRDMLIQSEKLASLGELVADMAHEVNNPLMIISGRAQLSLMEEIKNKKINENLKIITEQCERTKDIIQRLLTFSKPSKSVLTEVDVNKSLEDVVKLVEHQYSLTNTKIVRNYMPSPPTIKVDEKQMQEVFMNLLKNSTEAMPKGGTITISTSRKDDKLRIDFKDTGEGISEEAIKKLFEPFFTTKEKGTGLGLSVCYGIIKAHNGELRYESKPGKGTTATILLPIRRG